MTQTFHLQSLERAVTFRTIILSALKPQLSKTHYFHCHFIITLSLPRVTLSPSYSFHSSPVQTKISVENKRAKLFHVSNSQDNSHLERRKKGKCAVAVETVWEHRNTPIRSNTFWRTRHTTEQLLQLPPACLKGQDREPSQAGCLHHHPDFRSGTAFQIWVLCYSWWKQLPLSEGPKLRSG